MTRDPSTPPDPPLPALSLDEGTLDVWHLALTPRTAVADGLDAAERSRAERFRGDAKRIQFLAARAQLRQILARYLDEDPVGLRFVYGPHGKPALADHPELEFNLSHSGQAGLLGVARGTRIGVDVEFVRPGRPFASLASRFFASEEHAALLRLPEDDQVLAFYRAWACKEAYLKAWGTGLSFPSNRFAIDYIDQRPPRLLATEMPDDLPQGWQLRVLRTFAGHAAAVCFAGEDRWIRHFAPGTAARGCSEVDSR